jgi:hypothetical protein
MSNFPIIKRARAIYGKKLTLRDVSVNDAEFILSLRLDPKKSTHLSPVAPDVQKQIDWIENYLSSDGQAYFIICDHNANRLGMVRLYNATGFSFSWGSWVLKADAPANAAIESALIVYRYALEHLSFNGAHFAVNKPNKSVWTFHERFGAIKTKETDHEYFYTISSDAINSSFFRFLKFLPDPIRVEWFS